MHLAVIQIQALVKQAQNQYVIAYATKIGRTLVGPCAQATTRKYICKNKIID